MNNKFPGGGEQNEVLLGKMTVRRQPALEKVREKLRKKGRAYHELRFGEDVRGNDGQTVVPIFGKCD